MRNTVQTVLGPISVNDLGMTLMHEHVYVEFAGSGIDFTVPFDRAAFIKDATKRLAALKEHGVKTFVDPCPMDIGRDISILKEVSEKSGLNIVCATGFYFEPLGFPIYWQHRSAEEIAALLIHEIEVGIGDTGVKAGLIKVATGAPKISDLQKKFLQAATIANKETGVPILTHTEHGSCGPEQQELFRGFGVKPHETLIGHSCGNPDPNYHRKILAGGTYIGFDRIGWAAFNSDDNRADNLAIHIKEGKRDQLIMSQDHFCVLRGKPLLPMTKEEMDEVDKMIAAGEWPMPFTDLFTNFLPKLRQRGVSDSDVQHILTANPKRFFSCTPFA